MRDRLIQWFTRITDKPYVIPLLGFIAFLESIIFPIPIDIFTFTLASAHPKRWFRYAFVATFWSVAGAIVAYYLGAYLFDEFGASMIAFYNYEEEFSQVIKLFNQNTFVVIFTAAFTPIPYKVFTIAGGALQVDLFSFITASVLGRGLRFFAESWLPYRYGKKARSILSKHMKTISWTLVALVTIYLLTRLLFDTM